VISLRSNLESELAMIALVCLLCIVVDIYDCFVIGELLMYICVAFSLFG